MARLYADEDFPYPVVERLRQLGHDVLTAFEAGQANQRIDDAAQLALATGLGRALLTRNRRHYIRLHRRVANHAGIVSITDDPDLDGQADRIDKALAAHSDLAGQHVRVNRPNPSAKP
jgi:hypothetical protein